MLPKRQKLKGSREILKSEVSKIYSIKQERFKNNTPLLILSPYSCKTKNYEKRLFLFFHNYRTMIKIFIQNIFHLRKDVGLNFYIANFFFKYILRQNRNVSWAIHYTSTINHPEKIILGKNVFPGDSPGNYIEAFNGVTIGDFTNIGPNVGIISANHDLVNNSLHIKASPISIGRFCWIGMNATILPSVQLGDFTIVGAGSVVSKNFSEGYCVIGGNPAEIIKHLDKETCDQFSKSKL